MAESPEENWPPLASNPSTDIFFSYLISIYYRSRIFDLTMFKQRNHCWKFTYKYSNTPHLCRFIPRRIFVQHSLQLPIVSEVLNCQCRQHYLRIFIVIGTLVKTKCHCCKCHETLKEVSMCIKLRSAQHPIQFLEMDAFATLSHTTVGYVRCVN